jgi:N-formylglutamate amidohydrolase
MSIPDPPFILREPAVQASALVLASPHSGRNYPASFVDSSRLDARALRRSEDSFVDELYAAAPSHGAALLAATFPRAYCDANREAWELDPAMFEDGLPPWVNTTSVRVGAGLGTLARVVSSGEAIYRRRLRFADAQSRVHTCWEPYHAALRQLIDTTRRQRGACLLLDCHSMPDVASHLRRRDGARPAGRGDATSLAGRGDATSLAGRSDAASPPWDAVRDGPDFVLGDAHGTTCAPAATRLVETLLRDAGYGVSRNDPYAGGYVTRHYGRPGEHVHVLQIEVARGLYMDEATIEKRAGFGVLRDRLSLVVASLVAALQHDPGLLEP